jgi:hypothetical protein
MMSPSSALPLGTFQALLFANGTAGFVYRDLYGTEQALGAGAVVGESHTWRARGRRAVGPCAPGAVGPSGTLPAPTRAVAALPPRARARHNARPQAYAGPARPASP